MKPTSARAARRLNKKTAASGPPTLASLDARLARAKVKGVSKPQEDRAKRILRSYLQTAQTHGIPVSEVINEMANGEAARRLGAAVRDTILQSPPDAVRNAACADGCAFCCILSGGEGGVITHSEAARLHAALSPMQGESDGREWHKNACPALDPATRSCRVYDDRPMICRSFLSTDAEACRRNAEGGAEIGAGLLGSHLDYLAVHALSRQVLKGMTQVHSYSLAQVAAGAVDGLDAQSALGAARHKPSALENACKDGARAAGV